MDATPLQTIAQWAGGALQGGDAGTRITTISTDSRHLGAGDLFVALKGPNFDGGKFLTDAKAKGATGAIVEGAPADAPPDFAIISVADALAALQKVAAEYRRSLPLQVIAITGSNGKTSTKDLTASVLGERFPIAKTEGNLNNHIGLPLTILRARGSDHAGVFEIGMNHPGEIAPLAAIAVPDVAIITNIGVAHIEHMGSRDAIALEKGMLAEALSPSGTLILSANDEFSASIAKRTRADVVLAGIDAGDVQARDLRAHFHGVKFTIVADGQSIEAELPTPGAHMVKNAVLAVAAGRRFGLSLAECAAGLAKLRLTKGRLEQKIVRGVHILDDTYNANPDSVTAALRTLAQMPAAGRRVAVLGRMGELGTEAENGHRQVGEVAAQEKIDCVYGVGDEARWITEAAEQGGVARVQLFHEVADAAQALRAFAQAGDVVLVKGSRSARMERIVEAFQEP